MTPLIFGYALLGGIIPSCIWLYFLLKEDSRCPEPRHLIALTFVAGMVVVPFVIPLEHYMSAQFSNNNTLLFISWALIEEMAKYSVAAVVILWRKETDEPIDYVIYMITVALGFAAFENTLFILNPFSKGHFTDGLVTDDLRFFGSTLVHVLSSSAIGFTMAFSYMKSPPIRTIFASLGLILAVALHAFFNLLILSGGGAHTLQAFFTVWTGTIAFFALFEILKYFSYNTLPEKSR